MKRPMDTMRKPAAMLEEEVIAKVDEGSTLDQHLNAHIEEQDGNVLYSDLGRFQKFSSSDDEENWVNESLEALTIRAHYVNMERTLHHH